MQRWLVVFVVLVAVVAYGQRGAGDQNPPFGQGELEVEATVPPEDATTAKQDPIAALEKLGAKIKRGDDGKPVLINLNETLIDDASLAHLTGLTSLTRLNLRRTKITDAGLTHITGLTKLEQLFLPGTRVTDAGLANLKGLNNLKELGLAATRISDAGLM